MSDTPTPTEADRERARKLCESSLRSPHAFADDIRERIAAVLAEERQQREALQARVAMLRERAAEFATSVLACATPCTSDYEDAADWLVRAGMLKPCPPGGCEHYGACRGEAHPAADHMREATRQFLRAVKAKERERCKAVCAKEAEGADSMLAYKDLTPAARREAEAWRGTAKGIAMGIDQLPEED